MAGRSRTKIVEPAPETPAQEAPVPQVRGRGLVFISHDSRDADLAELFADLLSDVSGGTLKSFRSTDKKGGSGIPFGTEWYSAIMSQLDTATDVVALVTQQSVDRPWILYEAGVAKGKLNTVVLGVALGVPLDQVSTGPFGQFQNSDDNEDSLTGLCMQLLSRNPDAAPRDQAIRMHVRLFLDKVRAALTDRQAPSPPQQTSSDERSAALFEEVKAMVREMPERIESRVRVATRSGALSRLNRRNPGLLEDFVFSSRYRLSADDAGVPWLIFSSLMRDDYPWIYEAGMDVYRASSQGRPIERLVIRLRDLIKMTLHSPLGEMSISRDKESYSILHHFTDYMMSIANDYKPTSKGT